LFLEERIVARLIVRQPEKPVREMPLEKEIFTIGRMPDNDIELRDSLVSRKHSEIVKQGNRHAVYDAGSSNGTYVNGTRVESKVLEHGDEIVIGETRIVFQDEPQTARDLNAQPADPAEDMSAALCGGTEMVKSVTDIPDDFKLDVRDQAAREMSWKSLSRQSRKEDRDAAKFRMLYQIGKAVAMAANLDEVLDLALSAIFDLINAERGVIMLLDRETKELVPKVVKHRTKGRIDTSDVPVSRTITNQVLADRVAKVTSDAKQDPRFQMGVSVMQYNIRSALCVPLFEKQEVFGVIYVDNLLKTYAFQEDDVNLLTAVANQVGIRIKQEDLYEQLRNEAILRSNLERFHSPDVVEMIVKGGSKEIGLEADERDATVLFADIQDFTRLCEVCEPVVITNLLNTYYETLTRVTFEFKGSVNKFIGDSVMAIFGAPRSISDHPLLAVKAALKMQVELQKMRDSLPMGQKFNMRIGINTGKVVAGKIGSAQKIEYSVLGDVVNIASRLEKLARPNSIAIGDETFKRLKGMFQFRELCSTKLKGKEQETKVYEVLS
jgi:adenylate cyclase